MPRKTDALEMLVIAAEQYVRFMYDDQDYFEVVLNADGSLLVRTGGAYTDVISIVPEVPNRIAIVPLRWVKDNYAPYRRKAAGRKAEAKR